MRPPLARFEDDASAMTTIESPAVGRIVGD
jgi:hypothetical protein